MNRSRREPECKPPIERVLLELGATVVPTGGGWVRMKCFHKDHPDRTASASVNHDENRYRCHACGIGGDSYDLLQQGLELSYTEALEYGARLGGSARKSSTRPPRRRAVSDLLGKGARDSAATARTADRHGGRVRRALGLSDDVPE